jgi:hypothetical protein
MMLDSLGGFSKGSGLGWFNKENTTGLLKYNLI